MDDVIIAWSGGKDAAYAYYALDTAEVRVRELLTTINAETDRSSMHGIHRSVIEEQAARIGLPVSVLPLPPEVSNEEYAASIEQTLSSYRQQGIDRVVYGDISLSDVRDFRQARLDAAGMGGLWPLWQRDTQEYMDAFLTAGFETVVVAVESTHIEHIQPGTVLDNAVLEDLPASIDPAGEGGEFHTCVVDGPIFSSPLTYEIGEHVTKQVAPDTTIHYCDIQLGGDTVPS